jgi:hypothetical protein
VSAFDDALARLTGHYNANPKTPGNPGGMGGYGHLTNFEAALQDVFTVMSWLKPSALQVLGVAGYAGAAAAAAADAEARCNATHARAEFFRSLTVPEIWAFGDNDRFLGALALLESNVSIPLAWAATLTPDQADGWCRHTVLEAHTVLKLPANRKPGMAGRYRFQQPVGGGVTLSYEVGYRFPQGVKDIASTAGAVSCVNYYVHAADDIEAVVTRGYVA